ncbi:hypothetical protein BGW37DRAFT_127091 [Umbelopsis sp. PMI_123]|nr:hypothetical protein BGW37DRAFT_127091 [Umbelopsis sp. PMI_123]
MTTYHAHQLTAIRPTAIQHIIYAKLWNDSQDYVVFSKGAWLQLLRIVADGPLEPLFEQHVPGTISHIAKLLCNWTSNLQPHHLSTRPSPIPYSSSPIAHAHIVSDDVLVATSDQGSLVFLALVVPPDGDLVDNGRFELVAEVPLTTPGNDYTEVGRRMATDPQ